MRFCAANEALRVEREPNGELLVTTPAGLKTSKMNSRISRFLDEWAEADGRGIATDSNGGYTLRDGSMRAPDAAWVLNSRWQQLSEEDQGRFAPICPDFVIELRSPSDKLSDLEAKMRMWIANGAEVAWLIDPIEKAVTIYRTGDEPAILTHPTSVQGTGPVGGFELVMSRVWDSYQPKKELQESCFSLILNRVPLPPGGAWSHSPRPNGSSSQQLNISNSGWVQLATRAAGFVRWETRENG